MKLTNEQAITLEYLTREYGSPLDIHPVHDTENEIYVELSGAGPHLILPTGSMVKNG